MLSPGSNCELARQTSMKKTMSLGERPSVARGPRATGIKRHLGGRVIVGKVIDSLSLHRGTLGEAPPFRRHLEATEGSAMDQGSLHFTPPSHPTPLHGDPMEGLAFPVFLPSPPFLPSTVIKVDLHPRRDQGSPLLQGCFSNQQQQQHQELTQARASGPPPGLLSQSAPCYRCPGALRG